MTSSRQKMQPLSESGEVCANVLAAVRCALAMAVVPRGAVSSGDRPRRAQPCDDTREVARMCEPQLAPGRLLVRPPSSQPTTGAFRHPTSQPTTQARSESGWITLRQVRVCLFAKTQELVWAR